MTRVLHRISRSACPAANRPWLDALFAELDAVGSARARLVWLLGAVGLIAGRRAQRLVAMVSPAWLVSLIAAAVFGYLAFIGYEAVTFEDDWYLAFAAAALALLIAVSAINLRRPPPEAWP